MRVVIAGGHGQIALLLERMLAERGDQPVGLVRNPDHVTDLEEAGAEAVVLDLEHASVEELAAVLEGADAVVFAAGGGPNSGAARKETVDKGAAVLLADAAEQAGVRRYLMVSSMGTEQADPDSDDIFQVYLRAKKAADDDLRRRDLDWTVVRPAG
ncbi:MAG TPA: NAD(P)H-binding protein [Nocardioidaceae bacterium]|nr:NAD(P)H-binding protein [Nocardioidaceae bacterium]